MSSNQRWVLGVMAVASLMVERPASRRRTPTGVQPRGADTGRITPGGARSDVRAIATVVRPTDSVSANPTAVGRRGPTFQPPGRRQAREHRSLPGFRGTRTVRIH